MGGLLSLCITQARGLCQQRSHLCQEEDCPPQLPGARPSAGHHLQTETLQNPHQTLPLESHPGHTVTVGADNTWVGLGAGKFTPCAQADFPRRKVMSSRVLSVLFVADKPNQYLTSTAEISYNVLLGGLWP